MRQNPVTVTVIGSKDTVACHYVKIPGETCWYAVTALEVDFASMVVEDGAVPHFGSFIAFDVELPADLGADMPGFRDEIAIYALDPDYLPLFPTGDPFGTDAIFTLTTPATRGEAWDVRAHSPAEHRLATDGAPETLYVQLRADRSPDLRH